MVVIMIMIMIMMMLMIIITLKEVKCNLMMTIITIIITFNKVDSIIYSHFADEKIETKKIKYLVLCHTDRNRGKSKYWANCILLSYPTTTTTIMY